jgi:hypothetical protein
MSAMRTWWDRLRRARPTADADPVSTAPPGLDSEPHTEPPPEPRAPAGSTRPAAPAGGPAGSQTSFDQLLRQAAHRREPAGEEQGPSA